jgi:acyl-CoA thioester hydrolase
MSGGRTATIRVRVRFGETDAAGIVYYGSYIGWFDAAMSNLIRIPGVSSTQADGKPTYPLTLVEVGMRFFAPVRFDAELDLTSRIVSLGTTSLRVEHEVRSLAGDVVASGFEVRVFVRIDGGAFIKQPIPQELRDHLSDTT